MMTSCRLSVLADLEQRGKLDELRFLIKGRVKELKISEKEFERLVQKRLAQEKEVPA